MSRLATRRTAQTLLGLCVAGVLIAAHPGGAQNDPIAKRVAERLAALRREAEDLARQEKSILTDLRALELDRQIKAEELAGIEQHLKTTEQQLADTTAKADALRQSADTQQPDVDERLVRLYKMGRAGYWRLLLDVEDVQSLGRAYRTAAALSSLDRSRVRHHAQTLEELERERGVLQARAREFEELQRRAAAARDALERSVAARAAVVKNIESRRDLAAQFAAELDAANLRLQSVLAQNPAGAAAVAVPLRPFKGELPWPAEGIVVQRFGRRGSSRVTGITFNHNGIELSLAEGRPVAAVHGGTVTHSGPFTAFGQLVIIDHGGGAVSLYGHLASARVNRGDRVAAGSTVGLTGRNPAGNPSLYFELRIDGAAVDPLQWLRRQP
jgi:septal ring factor EnvC (AmiA/AmiB activator)